MNYKRYRGMVFVFEGKHYVSNMNEIELYGDGRAGSDGHNIPIKLPDGRFVRVNQWRLSCPPQPSRIGLMNGDDVKRYATSELIDG